MGKFFWAILSQKEQPIYFCQKILVLRLNCPRPWRIKGLVFFMGLLPWWILYNSIDDVVSRIRKHDRLGI